MFSVGMIYLCFEWGRGGVSIVVHDLHIQNTTEVISICGRKDLRNCSFFPMYINLSL